jgi:hypothetical protein
MSEVSFHAAAKCMPLRTSDTAFEDGGSSHR